MLSCGGLKHFVVHTVNARVESKSYRTNETRLRPHTTRLWKSTPQGPESGDVEEVPYSNDRCSSPADDRCASDLLCSGSDLGAGRNLIATSILRFLAGGR